MMWKGLKASLLLLSTAAAQQQVLSNSADTVSDPRPKSWASSGTSSSAPAINPGVRVLVQQIMQQAKISGVSIAVVHPDDFVETASWGIKSERQERMTTDVIFIYYPEYYALAHYSSILTDSLLYWVLLQGIPYCRAWHPDG